MLKIKIVSDGTPRTTKIVDQMTGEIISGVESIFIRIDACRDVCDAQVVFANVPLELSGLTIPFNDKLDELVDASRQQMQVIMAHADGNERHCNAITRLSQIFGEIRNMVGRK